VAELRRHPWGGRANVTVVVTDGVVYLEGIITDERERDATRVVAENVAGVKEVRDHLQYCDLNAALVYRF
jgi:osmotically-inducible protein OsmY